MSPRTTKLAVLPCALVLFFAAKATPQTRLKGRVHTPGNDPLVAREQVTIEGAGQYTTDDHGEFEFDLAGDLRVGGEARFHVYHLNSAIKIQQWIVIRPCDNENGRTLSLPAVGSRPVSIVVLPKGDQRLKSLNKDYSILECVIEEAASEFKPISRSGGSNHTSLFDGGSSLMGDRIAHRHLNESPIAGGFPRFVEAAYHVRAQEKSSVPSSRHASGSMLLDEGLLTTKAGELGFTDQELADAMDAWVRSVEDRYQRGLAALYERRYAEASEYISASIPSLPGEFLKRYVPLARAEFEQGHYVSAEAALRKVLAVHSEDPLILNNLGVVLKQQGKYEEAEPLYRQALTIDEKALGPVHVDVARDLVNLGALLAAKGNYRAAEPMCRQGLTIREKTLGPNHPDVASTLNTLGTVLQDEGDYAGAEPIYRRALWIRENVLGPDDADTARSLNNLASLLQDKGDHAEAETLYRRALEIEERVLGPEHPDTARGLNNLGLLLKVKGDYVAAEPLYRRALAIWEKTLGPNHPDVAAALNNLASLLQDKGDYAEAEPLYRRALAIDEKALGPDHPNVAWDLANLASLLQAKGDYAAAEPLDRQALAILEKALGQKDPQTQQIRRNLESLSHRDSGQKP